ncbi:MAG TPA: threonine synthase [Chryseosolibacter sp.]|nr:threonine synthase [Chryseosolibacter sp.]
MKFYSTSDKSLRVSLKDAVIQGLAPGNGLFMPERIPQFPNSFFKALEDKSFAEIAFGVSQALLEEDVPVGELKRVVDHTIAFDAPLVKIQNGIYALELFHGPTLAFKDFGARFMSQLLGYFAKDCDKEITILVATSGDTGSAVANGFFGVEGTRVIVLYPKERVSDIQEKQFTTLGGNITAIEIDGSFDDCQYLVKKAFQDNDLARTLFLTSANSINIARLIPQTFYYFYAYAQLKDRSKPIVFSVPSGNFGNLTAGLLAKRMGLPADKFIAATNANDIVPAYLRTHVFSPRRSVTTISNAMDVGSPSNFARLMDLYENNHARFSADVDGYSFSDEETASAMHRIFNTSQYLMDPHGAIGYLGLKRYEHAYQNQFTGIFLATAHPGKFRETVQESVKRDIQLPPALEAFLAKEKSTIKMSADFRELKDYLNNV